MNTRTRALVASAAVVGALLAGGSVALAADEVGPDSKACRNATIAHGEALSALDAAEKAEKKATKAAKDEDSEGGTAITDKEQVGIDALHDKVLGLAEKLDEAEAKLKDKCTDPEPEPAEPKPTVPSVGQGVQNTGEKVVTIVRERQVEVVPSTDDGVETGGL